MAELKEIRCSGTMSDRNGGLYRCGRLLLKLGREDDGKIQIEIKCPKCGKINKISYL